MSINYSNLYKYLDACQNGFWSAKRILTYGRPINIVTGTRSVGKSTGIACLSILDYAKNGHKFLYVRRHERDTAQTAKTFFNNAISIVNDNTEFKIKDFKYRNREYKADFGNGLEKIGMAWPLAQEEDLKSSSMSEYNTIIYDEFISKDKNKYLGTQADISAEWDYLTSLYQTIDRGINKPYRDEVCCFLLGNKSTIYNPICLTIGLADYVNKGAHFTAPKGAIWTWEDVDAYRVDALDKIKDSFAYKMSTEKTKAYAYDNTGADNSEFIERVKVARYLRTFKFQGQLFGLYIDDATGIFYLDNAKDGYAVYSLDNDSYGGTDLQLIHKWQQDIYMQLVYKAYTNAKLRFNNGKTKAKFLKYLQFM